MSRKKAGASDSLALSFKVLWMLFCAWSFLFSFPVGVGKQVRQKQKQVGRVMMRWYLKWWRMHWKITTAIIIISVGTRMLSWKDVFGWMKSFQAPPPILFFIFFGIISFLFWNNNLSLCFLFMLPTLDMNNNNLARCKTISLINLGNVCI